MSRNLRLLLGLSVGLCLLAVGCHVVAGLRPSGSSWHNATPGWTSALIPQGLIVLASILLGMVIAHMLTQTSALLRRRRTPPLPDGHRLIGRQPQPTRISNTVSNIPPSAPVNPSPRHALSVTDPVTGLSNRRGFLDQLDHEFNRALRYPHGLALVMLQIDGLKLTTDTLGMATQQAIARNAARVLGRLLRNTDIIGRTANDQFAIILPNDVTVPARLLAERIRTEMARQVVHTGVDMTLRYTVSIGVAHFDAQMLTPEELLTQADAAMHRAVRGGGNGVRIFQDHHASVDEPNAHRRAA